ncbi:MAG TPA: hypothetical protein VGJ68_04090, partial [Bradyrhizobium sp.]
FEREIQLLQYGRKKQKHGLSMHQSGIAAKEVFKIAAEKAEPMILRLVSELLALRRTFVSRAGLPECRKRRIPLAAPAVSSSRGK